AGDAAVEGALGDTDVLAGRDQRVVRDHRVTRDRTVVRRRGRGARVALDLVVDRVDLVVRVQGLALAVVVEAVAALHAQGEVLDARQAGPGHARLRQRTGRGRHDRPGRVQHVEVVVAEQLDAVGEVH